MGRAPCCDKASVKRGPWSPEEDLVLKSYVEKYGTGGNWIALPQKAGLKRCGKSCRLRWLNYLRPDIKHGGFSEEEDNVICSLYKSIGSRWSIIASHLPGRTDNDVKNHWNTKLKKKLLMAAGGPAQAGNTSSSHNSRTRRSPSLSTSAYTGSSPSTLNSAEDSGFGFSETAGLSPAPPAPLQPLPASLDAPAAPSSLAMDYSSSYAPWCDDGGAELDAFLMDMGMGTMEFPTPGSYVALWEHGHGEAGMASLCANAEGSTQGVYQSFSYS